LIRSAKLASIGQLAAGIAHEVGNPLAALTGYNELLAEGNLSDEDCADALNRSKIQLQRIQQIIRNLLDFSRIETTEVRPTNLGVHVKNVIELIAGLQRSRSVVIQWNDPGAPMALAEPTQFEQALLNLLLNALDAVEERVEPCISLDITWSDDTIRMSITDNGMGISLMDQEMIFDPFYTTKEPGKGTGLGLSIVHHMIEDMGGNIEVSSDGESGTKFELSFRRAQGLFCAK
jgi:signal transduction histidine kinase